MKSLLLKSIVVLLSFTGLSSCGVISTPYVPAGIMGGYSEFQVSPDTYVVTFKGNQSTNADTVQLYALRRAAELTIQSGYKYFLIQDAGTSNNSYVVTTPAQMVTNNSGYYSGNLHGTTNYYGNMAQSRYSLNGFSSGSSSTTIYPSHAYVRNLYSARIIVKMFKSANKKMQLIDPGIILKNFQKN